MLTEMPKKEVNEEFCLTPLQKLFPQLIIITNLNMTSNTIPENLLVRFKIGLQINSI